MARLKVRPINLLYRAAWAAVDFGAFIFLSVASMGYDDNYDSSKGEYGSLASMNTSERIVFLITILWFVFNAVLVVRIAFKIYKAVKKAPSTTREQVNL